MKIQLLPKQWDTSLFGFTIYSADIFNATHDEIQRLMTHCANQKIRLVYLFPKDNVSEVHLRRASIPLVDQKVVFSKTNFSRMMPCDNLDIYNGLEQYDILSQLALSSGAYSRFKTDTHFGFKNFQKLYLTWLDRSVRKEIADDVIIWKDTHGLIKGFITYKVVHEIITIGLIAVDPLVKGLGIGRSLIREIENIAKNRNITEVNVATQFDNRDAYHFYLKNQYTVKSIQPIYHLWTEI